MTHPSGPTATKAVLAVGTTRRRYVREAEPVAKPTAEPAAAAAAAAAASEPAAGVARAAAAAAMDVTKASFRLYFVLLFSYASFGLFPVLKEKQGLYSLVVAAKSVGKILTQAPSGEDNFPALLAQKDLYLVLVLQIVCVCKVGQSNSTIIYPLNVFNALQGNSRRVSVTVKGAMHVNEILSPGEDNFLALLAQKDLWLTLVLQNAHVREAGQRNLTIFFPLNVFNALQGNSRTVSVTMHNVANAL
jgi:hypothetical protein